jgi:uncharacterized protein (TIGR03083 family)
MTSDETRLRSYVDIWATAVADVVALLRSLDEDDWSRPTDCPGWDVKAVAAHLAHLESVLAGHPQDHVEVPQAAHVVSLTGAYTEQGPLARASWTPEAIVDELESSAATRLAELRADPPADAAGAPPRTPADAAWPWETLLSNRPLDVWMHEQDIRRAVGRPGGLDGPAAAHVVRVFARSLGFVVGKRVAPPAGTSVLLDVAGPVPLRTAVVVGEDGRAGTPAVEPADPTVTLRMGVEAFTVLSGGRRDPADVDVTVEGDQRLGARVLAALAVTP